MRDRKFWSKVNMHGNIVRIDLGPCWEWTSSSTTNGRGLLRRSGKAWLAYRYIFSLVFGSIPDGMFVLHHCDNPSCVRPKHLFLGTQKDNMRDMIAKGRYKPQRVYGEKSNFSKLTAKQVKLIRSEYTGNRGDFARLGKKYKVMDTTISKIIKRQTWTKT